MSVTVTYSNHFRYMLSTKEIDFKNDSFVIVLLNDEFVFNKDSHATLSDITASQLATNYGYTKDSKALSSVSVTEDDTDDASIVTWADVEWIANGGTIGPSAAACIVDTTTGDDTVVLCIEFGEATSALDGYHFKITDIELHI